MLGERMWPPLLENQNRSDYIGCGQGSQAYLPRISSSAPLVRDQVKTSGYNDTEGREEVGVARLTPAVPQTAVARGTGSSPGIETIRGGSPTVTEHVSVVLGGIDPVRLM